MKKRVFILPVIILILFQVGTAISYSSSDELKDVLINGRWFNDEFDFIFDADGNVKSHYTFFNKKGILLGKVKIKDSSHFSITVTTAGKEYNSYFVKDGTAEFTYVNDSSDPKSSRYILNSDGKLKLWNEKFIPAAGSSLFIDPNKTPCVALGNKLSTTIDNVRIRKGPGTEFDYMTYYYKEPQSGSIKSYGSILSGVDIRVLARTTEKFKVNKWNNYWYYIEYKEPNESFLVYKTAWMYGEFIYIPGDPSHSVEIDSPSNEESYYNDFDVTIKGRVNGKPDKLIFRMKNAFGHIVFEDTVKSYNRQKGTFEYPVSKQNKTVYIGSNTYSFVAIYNDGKNAMKQITLYFHESQGEMAKPVIYLYPEKEQNVSVEVNPINGISVSDPAYVNGWNVIASPDGKLVNCADGLPYRYLFWESPKYQGSTSKKGFVVATAELEDFFRDKLSIMGLNNAEIADFCDYWIPVLVKGKYYFIYFYEKSEIDRMAPIQINPSPDTVLRVFFDSRPLDKPVECETQEIVPAQRKGFTAVEWGGMKY